MPMNYLSLRPTDPKQVKLISCPVLQDKKKLMAEEPAFRLHGAYLVEVAKPTHHIAQSLQHIRSAPHMNPAHGCQDVPDSLELLLLVGRRCNLIRPRGQARRLQCGCKLCLRSCLKQDYAGAAPQSYQMSQLSVSCRAEALLSMLCMGMH